VEVRTPLLRRSHYSISGVNILLIMSVIAPLSYIFDFESSPLMTDLAATSKSAPIEPLSVTTAPLTRGPASPAGAKDIAARIEAEPEFKNSAMQTTARSDSIQSESKGRLTGLQPTQGLERNSAESKTTENLVNDAAAVRGNANTVLETTHIKPLIDRGTRLFEAGDVVPARLLFIRAAKAGDPAAALAVASTYDPAVLKSRDILGVAGDFGKGAKLVMK
jgi:hypothetical protein